MRVYVAYLAAALFLVAGLAGCSGKKDDKDADVAGHDHHADAAPTLLMNITVGNQTYRFTSASATSATSTHSGSSSQGNSTTGGNATSSGSTTHHHNATGNATGNGTGNATMPQGPAPLNVTFELGARDLGNASAARWTLDFGAGNATKASGNSTGNKTGNSTARAAAGAKLPATVGHTYTQAGVVNVTFSLQVGNATAQTLKAQITIANGTVANATSLQEIPFTAEGTIDVGTQGDGTVFSGCGVEGDVDTATHEWDLSAVQSIQKFVVHMDLGDSNMDSDIYLLDPSGAEIGSSADFNFLPPPAGSGSPTEDFEVEGPLAAGIYTLKVVACMGAEAEYSITAAATVLA